MKAVRFALSLIALLGLTVAAVANDTPTVGTSAPNIDSITLADMKADVSFMASDEMAGRETLRPEVDITAAYVKARFEKAGVKPAGENGGWYQDVQLKWNQWKEKPTITLMRDGKRGTLKYEDDFVSTTGAVTATGLDDVGIEFAGYAVNDTERGYNDIAGVDLKGKLALIMRYEPTPWRRGGQRNPFSRSAFLNTKEALLREAGAVGILMVTGPESAAGNDNALRLPSPDAAEKSPPLSLVDGSRVTRTTDAEPEAVSMPFFHISITAAEHILGGEGSLKKLQQAFDLADFTGRPDLSNTRVNVSAQAEEKRDACRNVAGKIEGELDEWIIFGAHHDHIGMGYFAARDANRGGMGQVHNGADDNASGVATVLEIAEALAASGRKPRRSFLFLTFTGEEKGLLGSSWYVKHPLIPHDRVVAMINIDMIGRIDQGKLELDGTSCSKLLDKHCREAAKLFPQLSVTFSDNPPMPASDHWPFFSEAGIPVFFPFGGMNRQMHTAEDDPETINYEGMVHTTRMLYEIAWRISEDPTQSDYNGPVKHARGPDGKLRNPQETDPKAEQEEEFRRD